MKIYCVIMSCFLLSSCSIPVQYFGDKLSAPATSVDIYYSAHDVTRAYKVIGHLTCRNDKQEVVKKALSDYAKKIGSDAIVVLGTEDTSGKYQLEVIHADALKYDK